jgi:hypothetical protein
MVPRNGLQLLFSLKITKLLKNSPIPEAREKISTDLESLEF